jgi:hypothetical protein
LLVKKDHKVTIINNIITGKKRLNKIDFYECDIIQGLQLNEDIEGSIANMRLAKKYLKWNHEINLKIRLKYLI